MSESPSQPDNAPVSRLARPRALRDILIVGTPLILLAATGNLLGLDTFSGIATINLGYILMILTGALLLACQGSGWRAIGLGRPNSWPKTLALGVAAFLGALLVFMAMQVIVMTLLTMLGLVPEGIDQSRFNPMQGNLAFFTVALLLAWTTIAFGEEMFFRAFLITRMTDVAGMRPGHAVLIAGVLFGVVHFAEGPIGILSNGVFGMLFGWIFLRSGRNLWITVIAHGLINSLRFGLLYAGAM